MIRSLLTIQRGATQTLAFNLKRDNGTDEAGVTSLTSASFSLFQDSKLTVAVSGLTLGAATLVGTSVEIPQTVACGVASGVYFGQLTVVTPAGTFKSRVITVEVRP